MKYLTAANMWNQLYSNPVGDELESISDFGKIVTSHGCTYVPTGQGDSSAHKAAIAFLETWLAGLKSDE